MRTIQVSMIGQPNVGKSSLFSRLTGIGVISSNYPGTTVEFDEATVTMDDVTLHFHDLPGTYSLYANSDDEKVVMDMLRDSENDVILVVADSTNLESSLVLTIEVSELGIPVIVALNKYDIASRRYDVDIDGLSRVLGVPVVPVSSKTGEGVSDLLHAIAGGSAKVSDYRVMYDGHVLKYVEELMRIDPTITWGQAIKLLEGIDLRIDSVSQEVKDRISEMSEEFIGIHKEPMNMHLARDRYGDAHIIVMEVMVRKQTEPSRKDRISEMTINPSTGIPILIAVFLAVFGILIFVGDLLATLVDDAYVAVVGSALADFGYSAGGELGEAIFTGIDSSISAILGLVIPYIMLFYILLGVLEDTGYLPRAVVLLDRSMHRLGIHGNGFIPMMVGFGCNVPAVMATRVIRSRRERLILCTIICMAIPCSAQLATITGVTGKYAGAVWVLAIFAILIALGFFSGCILNRFLKYEPSNLAMELPELQTQSVRNILKKTWLRISDFFKLAVPLLIVGSIIIELLVHYDLLDSIVEPMSWLTVTLLGLPAVTIIAFIAGILRKEMSYGMLVILAASVGIEDITLFMTAQQFIVFGIVMSIYIPCLATMTAMYRELGAKDTVLVSLASMTVAVVIGSIFNLVLSAFM
ncbi:MAG: ferrous iron transport protein B [Candidatus Methanomethylophilaceae archaeon]|nr:ferrous iron transport protein B [Candidatus Methanomethylophilaceae archaeon]